MEIRSYTQEEMALLTKIAKDLEAAGLNPFDTIEAVHLYDVFTCVEREAWFDRSIHDDNLRLARQALSRKAATFNNEVLRETLDRQ